MSTPYGAAVLPPGEMRSVTPAMNNTRYASAPRMGGPSMMPPTGHAYNEHLYGQHRSMTPNRYLGGGYHRNDDTALPNTNNEDQRAPSSTGLIRLTLKKPMGIVFEPMYDPHQPSLQRGVRICDLPRTGAAALSRKLQVGDELLQINDRTVSRLSFDEIMDFIIDADPESVNLLFRRPRKEVIQARQGVAQKLTAGTNKEAAAPGTTVKWVDEEQSAVDKPSTTTGSTRNKDDKKRDRKKSRRSRKDNHSEEDETIQSSVAETESYVRSRRSRRGRSRRGVYESESFLDMLIDTICSNSANVCRDGFRNRHDDYYSDEESFDSDRDESTYVTYDDSLDRRSRDRSSRSKKSSKKEDTIYEEDEEESEDVRRNRGRRDKSDKHTTSQDGEAYEDDGTLQTEDASNDRVKMDHPPSPTRHTPVAPLGLAAAPPVPTPMVPPPLTGAMRPPTEGLEQDETNHAPIKEVQYDDGDNGADVSVMESLGGPSLLIEKQRAAHRAQAAPVPQEIVDEFGLEYPTAYSKTRVETIQEAPLKFYTYVVKNLLEEHEPEKVRLLDKLLAKYKGREDHLVQKLSVRYNRPHDDVVPEGDENEGDEQDEVAFSDAVKRSKESALAAAAVLTAKERMQTVPASAEANDQVDGQHDDPAAFTSGDWPEKEEKEAEPEDEDDEDRSASGSEYSGDSVDGTSPAVIAQVSELLNYVYGKTSVPGQIDRVSTIMRAYEGREAVLLELLETKALIKANKEKENADNLPAFLRNSAQLAAAREAPSLDDEEKLPAVTPMAQGGGAGIHDDISSMSGVSSPAGQEPIGMAARAVNVSASAETEEAERPNYKATTAATNASSAVERGVIGSTKKEAAASSEGPQDSKLFGAKPPTTPAKKKKGIFGGLFGKRNKGKDGSGAPPAADNVRSGSRQRSARNSRA